MTEDYTPSIHIEPPPDSNEQALFASMGVFDNYCASSQNELGMNFATADRCYPQVPALFIQGSESPSSELSPLDDLYLQTAEYRYNNSSGRSSPIEAWSPASSFSGDIFPDDFADEYAPHWQQQNLSVSGHSSPALSPSLSPLTSAFDGFVLDESYPTADQSVLSSGPAIQRLRSASHSTPSPPSADVWADGVGRGRSASFSATTTDNQFYRDDHPVPQGDFPQYPYSNTGEIQISYSNSSRDVQISVADVDSFSNSLGTGMSWGSAPTNMNNGSRASDNFSPAGSLVQGWKYPNTDRSPTDPNADHLPSSPSLLAVPGGAPLQRRSAFSSRRSRSHSDVATLVDQGTGRGRGLHRPALSIPNSRSASSRSASPRGAVQFAVQTPASYSPHAPSSPAFEDATLSDDGDVSVERRRTFAAMRGPGELLSPGSALSRATSAPSSAPRSRRAKTSSPRVGLGVFKAERTDDSSFLSSPASDGSSSQGASQQEFHVAPPSGASSFKTQVASKKIRQASDARRTNLASFCCPLESCPSTFTARHNLINHINSHNKYRPHRCLCGMTFTTQGVLNRHKKRCSNH